MQDTAQQVSRFHTAAKTKSFNYNKLQAAVCIASSSVVSVALIIWAVKSFF